MSGHLVVIPTPIGNLEDITLRALSALRDADVIASEDTRAHELVGRMREGEVVGLVSDAGMPLVSDPGFVLVREVVAAGLGVEVLPGPSSVITALVASGLPAARWRFIGFLPRRASELAAVLDSRETVVAFESP